MNHRPANEETQVDSLVVRNLNRAAADEFANDGVAGDEIEIGDLFFREAFHGF
jgi:hypothetical protein